MYNIMTILAETCDIAHIFRDKISECNAELNKDTETRVNYGETWYDMKKPKENTEWTYKEPDGHDTSSRGMIISLVIIVISKKQICLIILINNL